MISRKLGDRERPVVTYSIMALCAVVFVGQILGKWFLTSPSVGVDPVTAGLWYAPVHSLPQFFEPWRQITAMFTHSTGFLLHILFNMYALWLFGPNLERLLGRLWFAALYLLGGFGGSLGVMIWVYFAPDTLSALQTATVGASGAIFALFAATLVAMRAQRVNVTSLAVLIGINFAIGLMPGAAISWQAHLGGMIVGALTMWILLLTNGPRKKNARAVSMVGLTVALVAVSLLYFVLPPVQVI